jgi:hypothetical protein
MSQARRSVVVTRGRKLGQRLTPDYINLTPPMSKQRGAGSLERRREYQDKEGDFPKMGRIIL